MGQKIIQFDCNKLQKNLSIMWVTNWIRWKKMHEKNHQKLSTFAIKINRYEKLFWNYKFSIEKYLHKMRPILISVFVCSYLKVNICWPLKTGVFPIWLISLRRRKLIKNKFSIVVICTRWILNEKKVRKKTIYEEYMPRGDSAIVEASIIHRKRTQTWYRLLILLVSENLFAKVL